MDVELFSFFKTKGLSFIVDIFENFMNVVEHHSQLVR